MKSFMTACVFFFVATQMVSAQLCQTQDECLDDNQCCSGLPPWGGMCMNLTVEGQKCHIEPRTVLIFGDFVIGPCPCADGLECVPVGGKKKNDGICQVPPTTPAPVVSEEPAGDDTPVDEPAGDDMPVEEPASDDTPADEPAGDDTPVEEPAGDDTPAEEPASDDTPAEEPAGDDTPAEEPAADSSAEEQAADNSGADSAVEA